MKKGQLTIFIIIGIVFVFLILLVTSLTRKEIANNDINLEPINQYIDNCVQLTTKDAIKTISEQGGFYEFNDETILLFYEWQLPYYYLGGKKLVPTKEFVANELSKHIEDNIDVCLDNFANLKKQGYQFDQGERKLDIMIHIDNVMVQFNQPITVKVEGKSAITDDLSIIVPSKLGEILTVSEILVDIYAENPGYICLSCQEFDESYNITMIPLFDEGSTDVLLVEIKNDIDFYFVMDYTLPKTDEDALFNPIPNQKALAEHEFYYKVTVTENVTFTDNTNLFNISPNGEISFTPSIQDIGSHIIEITAEGQDKSDSELFILNISTMDSKPEIHYIGYQTATIGERYTYQVNATHTEKIIFVSDTELFNISVSEGIIDFIPDKKGDFDITITAIDIYGATDSETMHLSIT